MKIRNATRVGLAVLLLSLLNSCYIAKHYTDNPADFDYVFFGQPTGVAVGSTRIDETEEWRIYALFGLVSWDRKDITWTADRLVSRGTMTSPVTQLELETQRTALNVLAEIGFAFIPLAGLVQPFVFRPRSATIRGRR